MGCKRVPKCMASSSFYQLCMKVSVNDAIPENIQVLVNLYGDPQSSRQCFIFKVRWPIKLAVVLCDQPKETNTISIRLILTIG